LSFELRNAGVQYGDFEALRGVSISFSPGEFVAIAGPNGAGKSTMLGVMAGLRASYSGECLFGGREIRRWNRTAFAKRVSVVPQAVRIEFPFTAEQIVLMGRTPHVRAMFESDEDAAQVNRAMELTSTSAFRARDFRSLSGGERQRVIVASALAQTPEALLLDEPTTHLDIEHQVSLYRLLRSLARDGMLVIAITHDLNLASAFADRIVVLRSGEVVADGTPHAVFSTATMRDVFRIEAEVQSGPGGRPWIHYGQ
jgi:ABC-type cobalamin/Fe3+-siderophores transport system ATPase subunit